MLPLLVSWCSFNAMRKEWNSIKLCHSDVLMVVVLSCFLVFNWNIVYLLSISDNLYQWFKLLVGAPVHVTGMWHRVDQLFSVWLWASPQTTHGKSQANLCDVLLTANEKTDVVSLPFIKLSLKLFRNCPLENLWCRCLIIQNIRSCTATLWQLTANSSWCIQLISPF